MEGSPAHREVAGKSTVLRLLAGDIQADAGDVRVLGRASVAYLRQSQELSGAGTLLDALLEPFADLQRLHEQLLATEAALHTGDAATLARYGEMQERYQHQGGYELEARVKRLMTDVGFAESELARFPEMPDRLRSKTEKARPHAVSGDRVETSDNQSGLNGNAAGRSGGDHGGMSNCNGEIDVEALRHRRDKRVHIPIKVLVMFLLRPGMPVIVRSGKGALTITDL